MTIQDKPLAADGFKSYRCMGAFNWIMIGAVDHADAIREALRSNPHAKLDTLQQWRDGQYQAINQKEISL